MRLPVPPSPDETAEGCLWCGAELGDSRTNEHVFPQWLLREFDLGNELIAPTHASANLDRTLSRRQHRLAGLVEGRVCAICNNGWMSALEVAVRPIISPLMRGERMLASVNHEERRVLARWAVKTAYNLNWSANYPRKVRLEHLSQLRTRPDLPDQVVVMAGTYGGDSAVFWLQSPTWMVELADTTREAALGFAASSYKISLQLGQLLLLVAYWPAEDWVYRIHPSIHRTLWPTFNLWAVAIGEPRIDFEHAHDAIYGFHILLGIVEGGAINEEPVLIAPPRA